MYREELSSICKKIGIAHTGTKQELNHNIEEYFKGNLIKKKSRYSSGASAAAIGLESPLIDCGFSFNAKFREHLQFKICRIFITEDLIMQSMIVHLVNGINV